ncbi:hypothetical protein ACFUN7_32515 [Streptomyces sp. NPDC057236]|uniref:hypothetical protein n=1 Tax=Streptomyces sp. NPDC057236 TaxID=3346059 RepID=UPI0036312B61
MSLDGFIAGPDHAMDRIFESLAADAFPEVMAATGAMLVGRGTYEVTKRMADRDSACDVGTQFVLTHEPPTEPGLPSRSSPADSRKPSRRHAAPRVARTWRSSVPTWPLSA